jgi:spermidine synthase
MERGNPMSARFAELAWQRTPIGDISLRRRLEPSLGVDVFEVLLGEEYLMSSLFTHAEEQLAHLGLAALDGSRLAVLVGGLGLGYTARAALSHPEVASLAVVEALQPVIDWHVQGLLPVSADLTDDPRTRFVRDDFFALMRRDPGERFDAILLDVDHSPRHQLDESHSDLYTTEGLRRMTRHLHPAGVFALWSDDPPDAEFEAVLGGVFATTRSHVVEFDNPLTGGTSSNTVYVAH